MTDLMYSALVIVRSKLYDVFGWDLAWLTGWKQSYDTEKLKWAELETAKEKRAYLFDRLVGVILFIIIVVPILLFLREIAWALTVVFAVLYIEIWLVFLPIITFFAVIDYAFALWNFYFGESPRPLRRFLRSTVTTGFVVGAYLIDDLYHAEIEQFLSTIG